MFFLNVVEYQIWGLLRPPSSFSWDSSSSSDNEKVFWVFASLYSNNFRTVTTYIDFLQVWFFLQFCRPGSNLLMAKGRRRDRMEATDIVDLGAELQAFLLHLQTWRKMGGKWSKTLIFISKLSHNGLVVLLEPLLAPSILIRNVWSLATPTDCLGIGLNWKNKQKISRSFPKKEKFGNYFFNPSSSCSKCPRRPGTVWGSPRGPVASRDSPSPGCRRSTWRRRRPLCHSIPSPLQPWLKEQTRRDFIRKLLRGIWTIVKNGLKRGKILRRFHPNPALYL